jgi:translation initiation factor 2B subunit (eIF-2B alpha/beta/delta family)
MFASGLGDVILTYSDSSLIEKLLLDARADKKNFKVIVSDGRVQLSGET